MATRSTTFDDLGLDGAVLRGLVFASVWNDGALSYFLERSDQDGDGADDWSQDGAAAAIASAFAAWARVADLTFTRTTNRDEANLIERVGPAEGDLGFHFLPGGNGGGGLVTGRQSDGEFNQDGPGWDAVGLLQGGYGFVTLLHEVGHALGLEHPHDGDLFEGVSGDRDTGFFGLNQGVFTTMSYADGWAERDGRFAGAGDGTLGYGWQGTPMALDVAAIQAIYGANETTARGDDVYALADTSGRGVFYEAIWDAGGTDEIAYDGARDASVFLDAATIDTSPTGGGLVSHVEGVWGGFTIARDVVIEDARTGSGDDVLVGNDVGNTLRAGAGDDVVMGRGGSDVIEGGAGDDLLIGDQRSATELGAAVGAPPGVYAGPSLPGGLGLGSGRVPLPSTAGNDEADRAVDLSRSFALGQDADVVGGAAFHTVTVSARGSGDYAFYAFSLTSDATVFLDLDGGAGGRGSFDSVLQLQDADGEVIAFSDDAALDAGSERFGDDSITTDSAIAAVLGRGTYTIGVGQYAEDGPVGIDEGATYDLHVSADGFTLSPPVIPSGGIDQIAYYYDTPDWTAAIASAPGWASGADGSFDGARSAKDRTPGRGHDHGHGGEHVDAAGGVPALLETAADDTASRLDAPLFAFEAELEVLFARDDALIA